MPFGIVWSYIVLKSWSHRYVVWGSWISSDHYQCGSNRILLFPIFRHFHYCFQPRGSRFHFPFVKLKVARDFPRPFWLFSSLIELKATSGNIGHMKNMQHPCYIRTLSTCLSLVNLLGHFLDTAGHTLGPSHSRLLHIDTYALLLSSLFFLLRSYRPAMGELGFCRSSRNPSSPAAPPSSPPLPLSSPSPWPWAPASTGLDRLHHCP